MQQQLRIPGLDVPNMIQPDGRRPQPSIWIRRLRVVRELQSGDEWVVRDVELRRGLNLVWAPPHQSPTGNGLFQSGLSGHTAGKSTFCRLVRFALGERGLARDEVRRRIREKLPSGWVLAEVVVVNGTTWAVARPFAIGAHPFCIRDGTVEQAASGAAHREYQEFLDAVGSAVTQDLPAARFPASGQPIRWEHILPWLSRDQECNFRDFLEWRDSSSDSEAPALSVDERQFIVRSVLGLVSDAERDEQAKNARLVADKKAAVEQVPLLEHQARRDHARVRRALGMELSEVSTSLFGSSAREELARRAADLQQRRDAFVRSDQRDKLQTVLEQAIVAETNAKRDLDDADSRLQMEKAALSLMVGDSQSSLVATLPPPSGYCNVPIAMARGQGCPLAASRPVELASRRSERTAAEEEQGQRQLVALLEAKVGECKTALARTETSTKNARRNLMSASTRFNEENTKYLGEEAQLAQIGRLVEETEAAWKEAADKAETIEELGREIEESYARQGQLRSAMEEAIQRFSARFDYVVRAMLGDDVNGRVDTSGRSLSLVVDEHGDRESGAIRPVKLLAFDLTALITSLEGHGAFPRLLIHDGPRESDMDAEIYERLFLLARELENAFTGEPSFQYIVTTTTPPPVALQEEPWMRLKLRGMPSVERLLRCDL